MKSDHAIVKRNGVSEGNLHICISQLLNVHDNCGHHLDSQVARLQLKAPVLVSFPILRISTKSWSSDRGKTTGNLGACSSMRVLRIRVAAALLKIPTLVLDDVLDSELPSVLSRECLSDFDLLDF